MKQILVFFLVLLVFFFGYSTELVNAACTYSCQGGGYTCFNNCDYVCPGGASFCSDSEKTPVNCSQWSTSCPAADDVLNCTLQPDFSSCDYWEGSCNVVSVCTEPPPTASPTPDTGGGGDTCAYCAGQDECSNCSGTWTADHPYCGGLGCCVCSGGGGGGFIPFDCATQATPSPDKTSIKVGESMIFWTRNKNLDFWVGGTGDNFVARFYGTKDEYITVTNTPWYSLGTIHDLWGSQGGVRKDRVPVTVTALKAKTNATFDIRGYMKPDISSTDRVICTPTGKSIEILPANPCSIRFVPNTLSLDYDSPETRVELRATVYYDGPIDYVEMYTEDVTVAYPDLPTASSFATNRYESWIAPTNQSPLIPGTRSTNILARVIMADGNEGCRKTLPVDVITPSSQLSGTVFVDEDQTASLIGGACTDSGSLPILDQAEYSLTYGGTNVPINPDGTYGPIEISAGYDTLELTPDSIYSCACPSGCSYVIEPGTTVTRNFYVNSSKEAWWQSMGGQIYAGQATGNAIASLIPITTCEASAICTPAISAQDNCVNNPDCEADVLTSGIAITGGGAIDSSDEIDNQTGYINERTSPTYVTGSITTKMVENYDYFYRHYSMGAAEANFPGSETDAEKPPALAEGDKPYMTTGNLSIDTHAWNVTTGEQIVIFVNGNLTIDDSTGIEQLITVEKGGFLAFIVSGDIIITPNVGNSDITSTTPNIEGVYITNGNINIGSRGEAAGGDYTFVGSGTFVGWSGINLSRDYSDGGGRKAENNDKPVELFIYRPDFVENIPEEMKKTNYVWQETN